MLDRYVAQVRLPLSTLPDIAKKAVFAIKGGMAINLFYRNMPRLSVDIHLAYLPLADRQSSLKGIDDAFGRIMTSVTGRNPYVSAHRIAGRVKHRHAHHGETREREAFTGSIVQV